MKRLTLVCLAMTLGFGLQINSGLVWAQVDLNGAWERVEVSRHNADGDRTLDTVQPSLYLFQDGYYSIMLVRGNDPRPLMPEGTTWDSMTEEQLRSVCSSAVFSAHSGTYEVSGSSLTTKPMIAKWPNYMEEGASATYTYRVDGDMLYISGDRRVGTFMEKLRRLRSEGGG